MKSETGIEVTEIESQATVLGDVEINENEKEPEATVPETKTDGE